jgi:hypothetical protein
MPWRDLISRPTTAKAEAVPLVEAAKTAYKSASNRIFYKLVMVLVLFKPTILSNMHICKIKLCMHFG